MSPCEVILFGAGRFGAVAASELGEQGVPVLVVDFDPEAVKRVRRAGISTRFGDAGDPEFISGLPLSSARWVLSAVRDLRSNEALLAALREQGFRGRVAAVARSEADAGLLERKGVDVIIRPDHDAAREAAQRILSGA